MVTVILCVFLLSYVYGEGKVRRPLIALVQMNHANTSPQSNYFKGSVLVLTYLVIVLGFYLSGLSQQMDNDGTDRFAIVSGGSETFRTVGRGRSGHAFAV